MSTNVISLEDALSHLEGRIPASEPCKKKVTDLVAWVIEWNSSRASGNQIFTFIRETENVGFAIDRDNNRFKTKKPNFAVIKLPGRDIDFKQLHIDFDLTHSGYSPLKEYLVQRDSNPRRWVALSTSISRIAYDDLKRLFLVAYERKSGVAV